MKGSLNFADILLSLEEPECVCTHGHFSIVVPKLRESGIWRKLALM